MLQLTPAATHCPGRLGRQRNGGRAGIDHPQATRSLEFPVLWDWLYGTLLLITAVQFILFQGEMAELLPTWPLGWSWPCTATKAHLTLRPIHLGLLGACASAGATLLWTGWL